MENKKVIISVLAVLVVLGITFFSQQSKVKAPETEKTEPASGNYWQQAQNWLKTNIYPKATVEIEKRGGELQQAALQQKDIAAKSVWEKIKIYFAEKFSNFSGTKVE